MCPTLHQMNLTYLIWSHRWSYQWYFFPYTMHISGFAKSKKGIPLKGSPQGILARCTWTVCSVQVMRNRFFSWPWPVDLARNSRPKAGQVYRNSMLQTSEFCIKWWLSLLKNDAVKVSWNNDIPRRWKNKTVPNQPAHVNRPLRLSLNTIRCCIVVSLKLNF